MCYVLLCKGKHYVSPRYALATQTQLVTHRTAALCHARVPHTGCSKILKNSSAHSSTAVVHTGTMPAQAGCPTPPTPLPLDCAAAAPAVTKTSRNPLTATGPSCDSSSRQLRPSCSSSAASQSLSGRASSGSRPAPVCRPDTRSRQLRGLEGVQRRYASTQPASHSPGGSTNGATVAAPTTSRDVPRSDMLPHLRPHSSYSADHLQAAQQQRRSRSRSSGSSACT